MQTIVHADDFGIGIEQSKRILDCTVANGGLLNSTSAIVGSPNFEEAAKLAEPYLANGSLKMGLHIDLVEGPVSANPKDVPLLANDAGLNRLSFVDLLTKSCSPNSADRDDFASQLETEIAAQINRFCEVFPQMRNALRLDSHQHTHMIPLVFEAMLHAADMTGCDIEYIRISAEPLAPFLSTPNIRKKIKPTNLAKNLLLNTLWKANKARTRLPKTLYPNTFYGLAFSGSMHEMMDPLLIDNIYKLANAEQTGVELLFHPGGVSSKEECLDPQKQGFVDFMTSKKRDFEAYAISPALTKEHLG